MSALLTNEMSAFKAGYDNMIHLKMEVKDEIILLRTSTGAGNEGTRGNTSGYEWPDTMDRGRGYTGDISQADAKVEKAL